jgi:2-keto-4-pentenoate hydratase/2-oxohepta-3-ene-1,7-dioic acid hydratase in catechol pathway
MVEGRPFTDEEIFWPNFPRRQINDEFKQNGTTSDMMFRIPQLLEHVSSIMTLEVKSLLSKLGTHLSLQ